MNTKNIGKYLVVSPIGELGFGEAQSLKEDVQKLIDSGSKNLVIDFEHVTLMGSFGLSVIIKIKEILADQGGDLKIVCANPAIQDIFAVTGTEKSIMLYLDEDSLRREIERK